MNILPSPGANSVDGADSGNPMGYSADLVLPPSEEKPPQAITGPTTEPGEPHEALLLVLGYLPLPDLLSIECVCKLFRDALLEDPSLWQDIVVERPLSRNLTNDVLLRVTSKARGKLRVLALRECHRITDAGLEKVVDRNPCITKLFLPECTRLSANGVVKIVNRLMKRNGNLKQLQIYGIPDVTEEHIDALSALVHISAPQQDPQPNFYHQWRSLPLRDDGRPIDVDICPRCWFVRVVFDCTRKKCRSSEFTSTECRGCFLCIVRCVECGVCLGFQEPEEDSACRCPLCEECWLQLPKCNTCNRPYCKMHEALQGECSQSAGSVCEDCEVHDLISARFSANRREERKTPMHGL